MDLDPPDTFDYIFYKGPDFTAVHAEKAGEHALKADGTIYGSDH